MSKEFCNCFPPLFFLHNTSFTELFPKDIEMLQNKIAFFDVQLQPLIVEVAAQSQMLDELLDAYERAVS